jgi:hypothetical protein
MFFPCVSALDAFNFECPLFMPLLFNMKLNGLKKKCKKHEHAHRRVMVSFLFFACPFFL